MCRATVALGETAFRLVAANQITKGNVLTVAQIAGIQAAKQTSALIPLCHSLSLQKVKLGFELQESHFSVLIISEVHCYGQTGVEMEALTAVSVAALTVYDMCKAVNKHIVITDIRLLEKTGGTSGR